MALTFLSPQFLWLLAALPVVVALHFLRSRRVRHDVSALFLWERARQVVAKRRRFSPTWLLAAQLLFTALAALVMARPALVSGAEPDRVVIVDASASMAARAGVAEDAPTRLELATELAGELSAGSGRLALIRAGLEAALLAPLEASDEERGAALSALRAGDAGADLSRALALAADLLPAAEVHLISDQELEVGQATVHVVGESVPNVGISALDIGIGQVFVGVVASGDAPVEVPVALYRDGEQLASGNVLVPANGSGSITFPLLDLTGVIEARLQVPAGDALALDDVAFAGSRAVTVVTDDGHGALTRAVAAVPNTAVRYSNGARFLQADLKVLTRGDVGGSEPGNYLIVPPPAAEPRYALVSDWDRAHPLLRFVDLSELVVGLAGEGSPWEPDPAWRVLARTADLTPVMRVRDDGSVFELQLAFHPSQSDIVLRPAFPALMANVVERIRTTSRVRLGAAPPGAASGEGAGRLLAPGAYAPDASGGLVPLGSAAEGATGGAGDGGPSGLVLASLLSAGESRLPRSGELMGSAATGPAPSTSPAPTGGEAVDAPEGVSAAAQAEAEGAAPAGPRVPAGGGQTAVGLVLLCVALLALLVEWALYAGLFDGLGRRWRPRTSAST